VTDRRAIDRQLVDECLQCVDPILFRHLASKKLTAEVYAFRCTPALRPVAQGSVRMR